MSSSTGYRILNQPQYLRMPWKNGLGETLEIASARDEAGLRFRISQAAVVENGVFSDFTGLHRTLVLLSHTGMNLTHESQGEKTQNQLLHALDMARFDGGAFTRASLIDGPIEDLNIMVRHEDAHANVMALNHNQSVDITLSEDSFLSAFYANQMSHITLLIEGETHQIEMLDNSFLIFEQGGILSIECGSGIFIDIRAR
ncbi:HutD family protein [Marinomonas sp. 15G1-11]|uniref:HutD family protein n=1 Tax=Marinomonas phaeophyticola TaxID=3004091 RepID=A0ABT4JUP8_9GAMM|nr:HutD family protein [Marinomonas sp. 15G1-11]MCZ2721966.1 HutD family protein [Marinomonas sp. 15G1-11]